MRVNWPKIREKILGWIFPESCMFCAAGGAAGCAACGADLPQAPEILDNTFSLFDYSHEKVSRLIWQLKYKHTGSVAKFFASAITEKLLEENFWKYHKGSQNFPPLYALPQDAKIFLVPIPLSMSDKRLHNHAEILANEIQRCLKAKIPNQVFVLPKLLTKNSVKKQTECKTRAERLANAENAFAVGGDGPALPAARPGLDIFIIVDDVTTTGATIAAAKKTISAQNRIPTTKILAIAVAKQNLLS